MDYLNVRFNIKSYIRFLRKPKEEFKITPLKIDKPIVETYTDAELKLLLERPNVDKCNFSHYRYWVIINFLLATACRLGTLLLVESIKKSEIREI